MGDLVRAASVDLEHAGDDVVARLRCAGFDAIDLSVPTQDHLTTDGAVAHMQQIAPVITRHGVKVASVTFRLIDPRAGGGKGRESLSNHRSSEPRNGSVKTPDPFHRLQTGATHKPVPNLERVRELVRAASAFGEPVCTVAPPPVIPPCGTGLEPVPHERASRYRDALNLVHRVLTELCVEAECFGITLAVRAPWRGCLLSPIEVCDLIDAVASPSVGTCVDVQALQSVGRLDDWLNTLAHRIVAFRLTEGAFETYRDTLAAAATNVRVAVIDDSGQSVGWVIDPPFVV